MRHVIIIYKSEKGRNTRVFANSMLRYTMDTITTVMTKHF